MFEALGFATLFEVILVGLVFWAIFNEGKFIAFEKRIAAYIRRRRFRVIKSESVSAKGGSIYSADK